MRIHTDKIASTQVIRTIARRIPRVWADKVEPHGSRTHQFAYEVQLRGDGERHTRKPNFGTAQNVDRFAETDMAATHDDWGHFLAALYEVDPSIRCADVRGYTSRSSFHATTNGRYNPNSPNYDDGGTK